MPIQSGGDVNSQGTESECYICGHSIVDQNDSQRNPFIMDEKPTHICCLGLITSSLLEHLKRQSEVDKTQVDTYMQASRTIYSELAKYPGTLPSKLLMLGIGLHPQPTEVGKPDFASMKELLRDPDCIESIENPLMKFKILEWYLKEVDEHPEDTPLFENAVVVQFKILYPKWKDLNLENLYDLCNFDFFSQNNKPSEKVKDIANNMVFGANHLNPS